MKLPFPFASCFCYSPQSNSSVNNDDQIYSDGQKLENFPVFSYEELKSATQGFRSSNRVGDGGFGSVYKGLLQDGSFVAVKVLAVEQETMRGEREFISELAALSGIKHENLVSLKGCCVDGAKRLLVYDYMENNSLSHAFLGGEEQNRVDFSWELRKKISVGVAEGLVYLHEQLKPHVVHRDIKSSNILLDRNFNPKLGDFGLARLFRDDASFISTRVAGTLGYLSPEYALSGHLTRKSDVYSFGVLLLEILTGGPVVGFDLERGEYFLVDKVWEMYNGKQLLQAMDPVLDGIFPAEEAVKMLKVGLLCVQETTKLRPKMSVALKMMTTEEINIEDTEISKPGKVSDLMDVKIGRKQSSQSFFSGDSGNLSSGKSK